MPLLSLRRWKFPLAMDRLMSRRRPLRGEEDEMREHFSVRAKFANADAAHEAARRVVLGQWPSPWLRQRTLPCGAVEYWIPRDDRPFWAVVYPDGAVDRCAHWGDIPTWMSANELGASFLRELLQAA